MDGALEQLRRASAEVDEADERRSSAMHLRDEALRTARDAGATYVQMQEASGLTPASVAKALRRV